MAKQKKLIDEHNFKIVLQQLAETEYVDTRIEDLDFESFSNDKNMFEYQSEALQNGFKMLFTYFNTFEEDKQKFYTQAYRKYPHANLDYIKPNKLLLEYFNPTGNRIEFHNFINRMSFWMTMGSGKTIVIIKLIELLDRAMNLGLIPKKTIVFFTANQGLLERFLKEIDDYNILNTRKIDTITLKDYEERQKHGNIFDSQQIKLFCYRSDLLSEDRKENMLDFKDYLDDGNNYIILDEAHKGDNQDSKRQQIFSILSQKGFLFNFSATFTDERDIATTIYNLNQAVWVKKGYGKKLFLLDNDLKSFKEKSDLNEKEKQKSLIKSLILLSYAKEQKLSLKDVNTYHEPMMVVFTNSVNTDDADAKLFFRQINLFINNYDDTLFQESKREIKKEFEQTQYLVTDTNGDAIHEFSDKLNSITYDNLKQSIFYAKKGNIEAIINPKEKGEIAFKLDSTDKPFGLLKIGDTTSWKNSELNNIKIIDTYKENSYFKLLDSSSVNILIGSRSFYEGWDTTRPNIMLFLNIGMDKDAKKFVTQSIGRGMRVESIEGSRQRLSYIDTPNKSNIQNEANTLETLFVISTNKDAIEHIVKWQEEQSKGIDWKEHSLVENDTSNKTLYIPTYKKTKIEASALQSKKSFRLSGENKDMINAYLKYLPKQTFSLRHNFYNKEECDEFYKWIKSSNSLCVDKNIHYKSLDLMIEKMKKRIYVSKSDLSSFKVLQDEIVHFRKIKVRADKDEDFLITLDKTLKLENLSDEDVMIKKKSENITFAEAEEKYQNDTIEVDNTKFRKLKNHYYNATISGEDNDWLKNIVSQKSEVIFLDELCGISEKLNKKFDWWMFSKINEHYDKKVFIPYHENSEEKPFFPDFIFWLQKDSKQTILFFDPKGVKHTDYEHKVDGYKELFELDKSGVKEFSKDNNKVEVKLALYRISEESVGKEYSKYWVQKDYLMEYFNGL